MYIKRLGVRNVKLLADQEFNFSKPDGSFRQWTVLLAENGLCKTTVLQLVALLASGPILGRQLLTDASILPNANSDSDASFYGSFVESGDESRILEPTLTAKRDARLLAGNDSSQQIDELRSRDAPGAFVVGYGIGRYLPEPGEASPPTDLAVDRIEGLFRPQHKVLGVDFYEALKQYSKELSGSSDLGRSYSRHIRNVLLSSDNETGDPLLPALNTVELRGHNGVAAMSRLLNSRRFEIDVDGETYKLSPSSLSQGYQSSIAWICDLLGHAFLDRHGPVRPSDLRGLVLLDEVDLHLHPTWQRRLLPILGQVFPRLQFIVTTHSPLVITGVDSESIIKLGLREGRVVQLPHNSEPGLSDASTLLNDYFGVPRAGRPALVKMEQRYYELLVDPEVNSRELSILERQLEPFWASPQAPEREAGESTR